MAEIVWPNGKAILDLREARQWTQESLALKARCAKRTIENAEAGNRLKESTLRAIAAALGVVITDIVSPTRVFHDEDPPLPNDPESTVAVTTKTKCIGLKINLHELTADEIDVICKAAAIAAKRKLPMIPIGSQEGCVELIFELTDDEIQNLQGAIARGELLHLHVVGIREREDSPLSSPKTKRDKDKAVHQAVWQYYSLLQRRFPSGCWSDVLGGRKSLDDLAESLHIRRTSLNTLILKTCLSWRIQKPGKSEE